MVHMRIVAEVSEQAVVRANARIHLAWRESARFEVPQVPGRGCVATTTASQLQSMRCPVVATANHLGIDGGVRCNSPALHLPIHVDLSMDAPWSCGEARIATDLHQAGTRFVKRGLGASVIGDLFVSAERASLAGLRDLRQLAFIMVLGHADILAPHDWGHGTWSGDQLGIGGGRHVHEVARFGESQRRDSNQQRNADGGNADVMDAHNDVRLRLETKRTISKQLVGGRLPSAQSHCGMND
jgi:hypothetical protein